MLAHTVFTPTHDNNRPAMHLSSGRCFFVLEQDVGDHRGDVVASV